MSSHDPGPPAPPPGPPPSEFYASLPRKRIAAGALFFNQLGELLVVKPTYRDGWLVPGGTIEADESPRSGCDREVREEIALDRPVRRLLCVEWNAADPPQNEVVMFLFDGGELDDDVIEQIRLPAHELSAHRFVSTDDVDAWLVPRLARRVTAALTALDGPAVYLDDGVELDRH